VKISKDSTDELWRY